MRREEEQMCANGGTDDVEFRKYLRGSIIPLFPDAKDEKGNIVMINIDSGPGRFLLYLLQSCVI